MRCAGQGKNGTALRSTTKGSFRRPNFLLLWVRSNRVTAAHSFPVSLLTETSLRVLASLLFQKTKTSRCAEDASLAGRGEQTL